MVVIVPTTTSSSISAVDWTAISEVDWRFDSEIDLALMLGCKCPGGMTRCLKEEEAEAVVEEEGEDSWAMRKATTPPRPLITSLA